MERKRACVLSGGFIRGAFQLGVLEYLLSFLKVRYDIITGISVGAVNGAWMAQFKHGEEAECWASLNKIWEGLRGDDDLYKKWCYGLLWHLPALWKPSLYNSEPLRNLIVSNLDTQRVQSSGKILRVGAVSINSGVYREWGEHDTKSLHRAVEASAAFPAVLTPVKIDGEYWLDGGVHNQIPLKTAIDLGATEIDMIVTSTLRPPTMEGSPKSWQLAQHALNLEGDEIVRGDLAQLKLVNELVKLGEKKHKRYIKYRLFKPESSLVDNAFKVDPVNIRQQREEGFWIAKKVCQEKAKEIPLF